jgi:hypothetical protein
MKNVMLLMVVQGNIKPFFFFFFISNVLCILYFPLVASTDINDCMIVEFGAYWGMMLE